ncbi:MAG: DUF853 family protein [Verrucomicrobia bacterium]|nr:DUF853 family protein [Verrucomicrobiota bacterium]
MPTESPLLLIGKTADGRPIEIRAGMANRHGLIAGATGTGKTVTLQNLAQSFSRLGVPVFTADVKGDLAGLSCAGDPANERVKKRYEDLGLAEAFQPEAGTTVFYDLYGQRGHPVRTTMSEMGPLVLGRLLDLNDVQQGVLEIAFRISDEGLPLLDLKDLRSLLTAMAECAGELTTRYGNVSKTTVGAIQRKLASLEDAGADQFFGEPAIDVKDFLKVDGQGRGVVSVLDATKLLHDGRLYATFLLWLLSQLFTTLDEVGDAKKPRLVFFFDEAHLLFKDAPKSLVDKIEQVVRLIRSKGVGVYFVTQSPLDIPETVLGQLGHRVQHALRAFTPRDQAAVRTAAETFRQNPALKTADVIMELAVGEALVSVLDEQGRPTIVERTLCLPPLSRLGPITDDERKKLIENSAVYGKYEDAIDRESAYEILAKRQGQLFGEKEEAAEAGKEEAAPKGKAAEPAKEEGGFMSTMSGVLSGLFGGGGGKRQSAAEAFGKSVARQVGSKVGQEIARGVLGSIFGGGGRRR